MQPGAKHSFAEPSLAVTELHTGSGSAAAFTVLAQTSGRS